MTSAQVVETSVNVISNSPSQDYTHPDDRTLLNDNFIKLVKFITDITPTLKHNVGGSLVRTSNLLVQEVVGCQL